MALEVVVNKPKMVLAVGENGNRKNNMRFRCPNCRCYIKSAVSLEAEYCYVCGQHLSWKGVNQK